MEERESFFFADVGGGGAGGGAGGGGGGRKQEIGGGVKKYPGQSAAGGRTRRGIDISINGNVATDKPGVKEKKSRRDKYELFSDENLRKEQRRRTRKAELSEIKRKRKGRFLIFIGNSMNRSLFAF